MSDETKQKSQAENNTRITRPLNGKEFLDGLNDGREIWAYGERIHDIASHPAFQNPARAVAKLYDALHDPAYRDVLTTETDTGSCGVTHPFFRIPRSQKDLIADRDAIVAWARISYGWLGRSPDYKASFLTTLGVNPEFYGDFADNAKTWYTRSQEKVLYWNHALINPPIDRHLPADEIGDVCIHVEKECDDGLIVSGAKVVATGSAITHYNFIGHYGLPIKKREFALVCTLPMNSPGLKLICRPSYALAADRMGSPFDYPLSSRFDENDTIIVLDKVKVPWENIFIYGDVEKTSSFFAEAGFFHRALLHGVTRLAVKLDFLCGLIIKGVEATGTQAFRGVQTRIGEVLAWRNMFWAISDAMVKSPQPWHGDAVLPRSEYGMAYRWFMTLGYPRIKEIIEQDLGSALIYVNSHARDFTNPELAPYLNKYVRGSNGYSAVERVKLMKLIWDSIGTEFAGRHELYERNYSGNHENIRIELLLTAQESGLVDQFKGFAEQCMSEYDLNGWIGDDFIWPSSR
ncbi:4-nitrophenol 2-monooxygenase, oxygenase component [Photorhabdus australis subsp. thailandensis]|uniref:4-nitrophenol 2-monooxygenase, oxygenase component n=1 Tax=Photorhabdus australis subsp. thailandensis TaxID=2805096 RepID=A0A1C0U8C1_9GAMM|nr:4-hydroxyphenylacetate 3-hydroxylase N-terminal domain-containing protein [Photorhabdus australis]OCQ54190.1 4-nitrophenol 2-monooxygenase, oxygenase component [Photorhabdus australis subsp. thailandensis]